ncbi:hypothetical protein, partial [uncultured Selenomonas sp.]|uniref:hypothetical protein n=1 Tax=uncultured Selenomonas sp. TaxID=159275 RepID=UPI0025E493D9
TAKRESNLSPSIPFGADGDFSVLGYVMLLGAYGKCYCAVCGSSGTTVLSILIYHVQDMHGWTQEKNFIHILLWIFTHLNSKITRAIEPHPFY